HNGGDGETGDFAPSYVIATPGHDDEAAAAEFNPVIVAGAPAAFKRLSVSEAVIELDMTGVPVVVFRHAGHGRVNLVYRRADGNIGWVDPAAGGPRGRHLTPGNTFLCCA